MRQINQIARIALAGIFLATTGGVAATADTIKLLAYGDSLTAGYGLSVGESFASQLEAAMHAARQPVTVINAGLSGDTTTGGLSRLDWTLSETPDAVLLELGANDGLRGIDPAVTRGNLHAILSRLDALGLPVLFTGMYAPPNMGKEYSDQFRAVFEDLAALHDVVFYPFFLDGVAGIPDLNQQDGIHPNARGVALIVERMLPYVQQLLARLD